MFTHTAVRLWLTVIIAVSGLGIMTPGQAQPQNNALTLPQAVA